MFLNTKGNVDSTKGDWDPTKHPLLGEQ